MAQLLVRNIEERVVKKLKERAARRGVSVEEEHRRILREALVAGTAPSGTLRDHLLGMPDVGTDADFERRQDLGRRIQL